MPTNANTHEKPDRDHEIVFGVKRNVVRLAHANFQ